MSSFPGKGTCMIDEYVKAKKLADQAVRKAVLKGEYPYLPALEDILSEEDMSAAVSLGLMEIPLDSVAGTKTKARQNVFALNFLPCAERDSEFAMKWNSLYESQEEEGIRDPILVCEYKRKFYVVEGNKRVSVLKYLNAVMITADVRRIQPKDKAPLDEEFAEYFRASGLYIPLMTKAGNYRQLTKIMGEKEGQKWDDKSVRSLTASYYQFRNAWMRRFADDMEMCGDAFLICLSVYGTDGIRNASRQKIEEMLRKIRKEIDARPAEIREAPEEKKETKSLKDILPFVSGKKMIRAAFLYDGDPNDSVDVFEHEMGRILVEHREKDQLITQKYEGCRDKKQIVAALEDAVKTCDVIFTTSAIQYEETFRFALRYPEKQFLNCSLGRTHAALRTYALRRYQAEFLLGVLAAVFSARHKIAYIAEYPESGVIADINAFAIGAAMIDPEAKVYLGWTGTLDSGWQDFMKELDIDVFSASSLPGHTDEIMPYGVYQLNGDELVNLAVPVVNWGRYYTKLLDELRDGWQNQGKMPVSYWWGMRSEVLDVRVSERLPYASEKLIDLLKKAVVEGNLDPFDGELHSQEAMIKGRFDPKLKNEEIIRMNWLNDNVIGVIPQMDELNETGKKRVEKSADV